MWLVTGVTLRNIYGAIPGCLPDFPNCLKVESNFVFVINLANKYMEWLQLGVLTIMDHSIRTELRAR